MDNEAKIINFKDYSKYQDTLTEIIEQVTDIAEEIEESMFNLACLGKWKEWDEEQPEGTVFDVSEEMMRNTGDKNNDLLWELLDKITEVKEQIRVVSSVETAEELEEDDDDGVDDVEFETPFEIDDTSINDILPFAANDGVDPKQMTMTFQGDEIAILMAGSGTMIIDWGDGTPSETCILLAYGDEWWV
jgi:hypothetical protein